ncbi:glycosyl hydrolase 53 family protein [Ruminococcus sp.]|uniref:glycosyl hydrolase 53 family protein n=1 Tax=Ruminococcus sp. TaxID=41978 RepID=UPI0025FFA169|nr:glycosyl hydrolase 53 family protein [Ruminococcus sp.]
MKAKRLIAVLAAALIAFPSAFRTDSLKKTAVAANIPSVTFTNFDSRINGGEPIRGVDISSIISIEEAGVKFYDDNGKEQDIFQTLAEHGVNYIRVRIWNEPHDDNGNTYGGGHSDLETAAKIGKRAAEHGMKLLADIHYSDFWADPAKQTRPKYWMPHDHNKLKGEIYNWTSWVVKYLTENGSDIGMVQVGNETDCFFCGEKDMYEICDLFSSGEKAVRDFDRNILIAHHFANAGNGHFGWYAQVMAECKLDYDIFACSYYSYWHGSLDNLQKTLTDIGNKYNKYVMVVETAYPYTNEDGDTFGNTVTSSTSGVDLRYNISVDGQTKALADVFQTVANCNGHGIGAFYWEPAWLGVPDISWAEQKKHWEQQGSGWATVYAKDYDSGATETGGSSFDNQALFDFHGKPLDSLDLFLNIYPQKKPVTTTTTSTTTTTTTTTTTITTTTTTAEFTETKEIILGDINSDGAIDVFDVVALRKAVIAGEKSAEFDLNADGKIGIADLVKLQVYILGAKDNDLSKKIITLKKNG